MVKSKDEMDTICWMMIFLPIGNIGWGMGEIVQSILDIKDKEKNN
jgi:hypothetical protein